MKNITLNVENLKKYVLNFIFVTISKMKKIMNKILEKIFKINSLLLGIKKIRDELNLIKLIMINNERHKNLIRNPKKLCSYCGYEYQVLSQQGEDGIIAEIFNRIGETNKYFVEFGVGDGLENNTASLLFKNWKGYWIEANHESAKSILQNLKGFIEKDKLVIKESFVTAENIEKLFHEAEVPKEFDLLSIDIDGNDYWIWKSIQNYQPRVVVIEYNASWGPSIEWVMEYNPKHRWDGTSYLGASLKSLELIGNEKGYKLVGSNGVNAFFIRNDLVKNKFLEPFTSENHYEPKKFPLPRSFKIFKIKTHTLHPKWNYSIVPRRDTEFAGG